MIQTIKTLFHSLVDNITTIVHQVTSADPHLVTITIFFSLAMVLVVISINQLEKEVADIQKKIEEDIEHEQKNNSNNEHHNKTDRE